MTVERMRRIFDVNVLGVYLTAREAARRLATSLGGAGGSIVLISSTAARIGSPNLYVDYAGSKAAVDTLAIGLSKELAADGVRVNSVRPGLIDTEIHAKAGEPERAFRSARRRRWGGRARPTRSPRRWSGCSATPPPTSPARSSTSRGDGSAAPFFPSPRVFAYGTHGFVPWVARA